MTTEQYISRKRSLEKMKELHKDDPYILSYLVDIERNWEKSLKASARMSKSTMSRYYYDDISSQRKERKNEKL